MKWELKYDSTGHPYMVTKDGKHYISKALIKDKTRYTAWANGQPPKSFDTKDEALAWCCQATKV